LILAPRTDEHEIVFSNITFKTNEITRISPLRAIEQIEKIEKINKNDKTPPPPRVQGVAWQGLASLALAWLAWRGLDARPPSSRKSFPPSFTGDEKSCGFIVC
jgi:hypothetical protein